MHEAEASTSGATSIEIAADPLFPAVYVRVKRLLGGAGTEETTRIANALVDQMGERPPQGGWDEAKPESVSNARWNKNVGRSLRVVGHVSEVHDPAVMAVPSADGAPLLIETTAAKITGVDGAEIHTLDVVGRPLIEKVLAACRAGTLVECLGSVVVLPIAINPKRPDSELGLAGHFFFHLEDVREAASAFDLLAATGEERNSAARFPEAIREKGQSPFRVLRNALVAGLGIAGSEESPHLMAAIEFVILQALSDGWVGNAPGRLHMLVPGPPGQGKKLLHLAARALNAVTQEAAAAKCSPAGLIGASYRTKDGWRTTPGLLPLASSGVLCIQDAHGWNRQRVEQLGPILQELMEDGEVRDSVAGGRKRTAKVGLLIDLNRHSQLQLGGRPTTEAPLLTLLPLLSRFDAIVEIPVDAARAWSVGERMYAGFGNHEMPLDRGDWVRRAQLLVATLRDKHRVIDTSGVVSMLEATHREIQGELADMIESHPIEASAIPARMAVTMTRMTVASARAHDRSVANEEDVQRAASFTRRKLAFLRTLNVSVSESPTVRSASRDAYYREHWSGREARPEDVARAYANEIGEVISARTVKRDFERLAARRVRAGVWVLESNESAS